MDLGLGVGLEEDGFDGFHCEEVECRDCALQPDRGVVSSREMEIWSRESGGCTSRFQGARPGLGAD